MEYFRKGSAASHLSTEDFRADYFTSARHFALKRRRRRAVRQFVCIAGTCGQRDEKPKGKTLSFDPNLRPVLWKSEAEMVEKLNRLAFKADWVLPGLKRGVILTGQQTPEGIADFYLSRGVKAVVIKNRLRRRMVQDRQRRTGAPSQPLKVDNVVDTVGAGDGFAVGVISALLEGKNADASREPR